MNRSILIVLLPFVLIQPLCAGEAPGKPKQIPPPGIDVPAADRAELEKGLKELDAAIAQLREKLSKGQSALLDKLADVEVYASAVRTALQYNEILVAKEIPAAKVLLKHGLERARQLDGGSAPWATATGLIARGYVSKIDGSVQPYGLVVPPEYKPDGGPYRLDFWFHGRGETLTELNFLTEREKSAGEFTPPKTIVVHLYGRFCNANKFAGEVDLFEALDAVRKQYPIDENRILVRGFSMGGAACWQFATHFAGLWAAAAPGAGFAETAQFSGLGTADSLPWYEKTLWHMYDSTDYAGNLFNCPTVAYSGEIDKQRQAAEIMTKAMAAEGLKLTHVIGPKTAHKYEPEAKKEVARLVDDLANIGRNPVPNEIRFTTWTLRYNQMKWVTVDALGKHWERARVNAEIVDKNSIKLTTQNVTALTLSMPAGLCPLEQAQSSKITIDGLTLTGPAPAAGMPWTVHFQKGNNGWAVVSGADDGQLHKRHGLQGPIDDAFMDSFVMVRPTGKPQHPKTGAWLATEFENARQAWRRYFRGETPVIDDNAVTDNEIATKNLILWGDPASNLVLAKIADKLPIRWDEKGVHVGEKTYSAEEHIPVLIYPNPLNPKRYVVLNSGFTFMEHASGSNARHVSLLPDWAVIDVTAPHESRVKDTNFFGEKWELLAGHSSETPPLAPTK